ncbi:hypothetical protein T12_3278, partial [Trichinella patagoniensis]
MPAYRNIGDAQKYVLNVHSVSLDKKGCGGAIWTNLDVTSVIKRNDHIESCPVDVANKVVLNMIKRGSMPAGQRRI